HYMLAVLSFLMVLAAAVLTVGSIFLLTFGAFLLVAIITFVLMEMRHSIAAEREQAADPRVVAPSVAAANVASPSSRMAYGLLAIAPALMLTIMGGRFFFFFFLAFFSRHFFSSSS